MIQNQKIKIALIEDDILIRKHIEAYIQKTDRFMIDFSVSSYSELCTTINPLEYNPDVVLLDMVLNGQLDGGIQVIQWFKKRKKQLPNIIVMSGYCDEWMTKLMQQEGVRACVSKSMILESGFLEPIIQKVMSNAEFVGFTAVTAPKTQPLKKLTPYQQNIVDLLKKGLTQNDIAETLNKPVSTINNMVAQIKKKHKAKTTAELIDQLKRYSQ